MGSWDISFFIPLSPPTPLWKAILCSFYCWRLEKRQRPPFIGYWGVRGGRKKWNVQLYFQPPPSLPPPPHFLFRSAAAK